MKGKYAGQRGICPVCRSSVEVPGIPGTLGGGDAGEMTAGGSADKPASGVGEVQKKLGRFEIQGVLGEGAFGKVYKARDPQLDRQVAIKVPRLGVLGTHADAQRFLREARAAANLRHPHIVPIYDAGEVEGTYYIASAFIEGQTLRAWMREAGKLDPEKAALLIEPLALALHYAHEQGVVHRDIKPDNVLLDRERVPHIADFGLARREDGAALRTQEGVRMGTPAYMSPEQHEGRSHEADARSDLWALGVLLYELLTGERPFQGDQVRIAYAVMKLAPTPPRRLEPRISADIETICLKCLAKEPDGRYANCRELAEDLQRWRQDEPIHARRVGRLEQAWKWARRQPVLASLAAAVTLLAVVSTASAVGIYFARRETSRALQNEQEQRQVALDQRKLAEHQTGLAERNERVAIQNQKKAEEQKQLAGIHTERARNALAKLKSEEAARKQAEAARERETAEQAELAKQLKQSETKAAETASGLATAEAAAKMAAANAAKAAEDLTWQQYTQNLQAADRLLTQSQWEEAARILHTCPEKHRAWEWKLLSSLAAMRRALPPPQKISAQATDEIVTFGSIYSGTAEDCVVMNVKKLQPGSGPSNVGIALWRLDSTPTLRFSLPNPQFVYDGWAESIATNGRFVFCSRYALDINTGTSTTVDGKHYRNGEFSPDGNWLMVSGGFIFRLGTRDWHDRVALLSIPELEASKFNSTDTESRSTLPPCPWTFTPRSQLAKIRFDENSNNIVLHRWPVESLLGRVGPPQEVIAPVLFETDVDIRSFLRKERTLPRRHFSLLFSQDESVVVWGALVCDILTASVLSVSDREFVAISPDGRRGIRVADNNRPAYQTRSTVSTDIILCDTATFKDIPYLQSISWKTPVATTFYINSSWTTVVRRVKVSRGSNQSEELLYWKLPDVTKSREEAPKVN